MTTRARSWEALTLIVVGALTLATPHTARADDALVLGGATSGGYAYSTGVLAEDPICQVDPTSTSCVESDVRVRAGGLLAYRRRRTLSELQAALFAGALIAARNENFRKPVGSLSLQYLLHLSRSLDLTTSLFGAVEPLSSEAAQRPGAATGNPVLSLEPAMELGADLGRRYRLSTTSSANVVVLLTDETTIGLDEVAVGLGLGAQVELERVLDPSQSVQVRALGRLMQARTKRQGLPPATGLVGGLAGYTFERGRRIHLHAMAGAGRVLNMGARSHLWPVLPLADLELALDTRLDRLAAAVNWRVREDAYYVGLPAHVLELRLGWTRYPSDRSWYASTELAYELTRVGEYTGDPPETPLVLSRVLRQHVLLRGRLTYVIGGGLRLFGELTGAFGTEDPPIEVQGQSDLRRGFVVNALVGVAFLLVDRPEHERLLSEVW